MSITVADLLKLPSMRGARVIAGEKGLSRIVSTISVLESTDPGLLTDTIFHNDEFYGSEIVITGFLNILDNLELQLANMRRLAEGGEVGLVLYYVGALLPRIAPELRALADELDFPIICMPEGRLDLRYSELITEGMEAIIRDQMSATSLVIELLERVARLLRHQRTIETVLRMLSDRIRACVALTDGAGRVINEAAWPRTLTSMMPQMLRAAGTADTGMVQLEGGLQCLVSRRDIDAGGSSKMFLFLMKEGKPLTEDVIQQAAEAVQLAANIWSKQHVEVIISELVRAILQDEPLKMRRLADIFHIDVASIQTMWILRANRRAADWAVPEVTAELRELLLLHCGTLIMDVFEGEFVIFLDGPACLADEQLMVSAVEECLRARGVETVLTICSGLQQTIDVRAAFLMHRDYLEDTQTVFPGRRVYRLQELRFVRGCREAIEQGEQALREKTQILTLLSNGHGDKDLKQTLAVFLLDADSSVTQTAELLFVHKNTIKYRIQRISELLGFKIGKMPETMDAYQALAIDRLLS